MQPKSNEPNRHGQRPLFKSNWRSNTHRYARIWVMLCNRGHIYGSNSCDAHERRCQACDDDARPGEAMPLPSRGAESRWHTLVFRRQPCYGPCPFYIVRVTVDGMVQWYGEGFVDHLGDATWQLEAGAAHEVSRALEKAKFFSLADEYGCL